MPTSIFYSTNDKSEQVNFETALMNGLASKYGLYMVAQKDIPRLKPQTLSAMTDMTYAGIAFEVLHPFLQGEISNDRLTEILDDAYDDSVIPTRIQHVTGKTHLMWLTAGPTYSFKDYAARFFGRMLNHFLEQRDQRRVVAVATSGDTGGAVADALHGLDRVDNLVFFPKDSITERQRRQMTTLQKNVHAFAVNGDFDVCQALAKRLLGDKGFAGKLFKDEDRFTSANSISLGRLLPQAVYPFFAYSRLAEFDEPLVASIPSGNFGDMMGTLIARAMGLPIETIVCGVNENKEFPTFLKTESFDVYPSIYSPSSAMIVSNPSNFARLVDFYGGHVTDLRDGSGKVVQEGVMDAMPDIDRMRKALYSVSVSNPEHYEAMKEVFNRFQIIIEPHGAVGWRALDRFLDGKHDRLSVIYATADPGKFPDDVEKAIGRVPDVPAGIAKQAELPERVYRIDRPSDTNAQGALILSDAQYEEALGVIEGIYR
jgi:threonine synthase